LTDIANSLYGWLRRRQKPGRSCLFEVYDDPVLGRFWDDYEHTIRSYCHPGGIVNSSRLGEVYGAWWQLDKIAQGDVDAFVGTEREWKAFNGKLVYLIERGEFALFFVVAEDGRLNNPVIVALACGMRESDNLRRFWTNVILPRLQSL
jgi:hypothetical protein